VQRSCQELIGGRYPFERGSAVDVTLADFAGVFGAGGVFDSFFRSQLAPYVDTSRSPWRWREGAAAVGGSASMLQQFQRVQRIRELYFPVGSQRPQANFDLTPDFLDASATRFTLEVDGQAFEYRHGPQQTRPMSWPREVGQAAFAFEDRGGPIPGVANQGPWAWFRVLDQAQVEHVSDTVYRVSFNAGGKTMRVLLKAQSTRNPYGSRELAGFRCGS
jgi:type VI secretion system protein ImpL